MRNRTIAYFEGKISHILSKNPQIQDIHELAIQAMRKQNHSDINEFYLDCALEQLRVESKLGSKKVIQKKKLLNLIPLAA